MDQYLRLKHDLAWAALWLDREMGETRDGSVPVHSEIELQRQQLHGTVRAELSDDGVGADELASGDQHAVVAPTRQKLGEVVEAGSKRSTMLRSSKVWKSVVEGSPLGPRSLRSCRSRSSKNDGAARTPCGWALTRAEAPRTQQSCARCEPGSAPAAGEGRHRGWSRCSHRRSPDAQRASSARARPQSTPLTPCHEIYRGRRCRARTPVTRGRNHSRSVRGAPSIRRSVMPRRIGRAARHGSPRARYVPIPDGQAASTVSNMRLPGVAPRWYSPKWTPFVLGGLGVSAQRPRRPRPSACRSGRPGS
jgi:hypothetical protein